MSVGIVNKNVDLYPQKSNVNLKHHLLTFRFIISMTYLRSHPCFVTIHVYIGLNSTDASFLIGNNGCMKFRPKTLFFKFSQYFMLLFYSKIACVYATDLGIFAQS